MEKTPRTIDKVIIRMDGDWEAGIRDAVVTLGKDGDALFDEDDLKTREGHQAPAEEFRQKIKQAFECIWGEQPSVEFDIEINDEADRIDAMYDDAVERGEVI